MIDTEKIPLTEADTAAYDSTAQILKAAMAYVNPSIGRMMAVMAKSIELRHMMQYLDQGGVSACGVNNRAIPPEEVIRDLRKYCGAKEKEQLDRCLNMMNMAKMYDMYRNFSGSGDLSAMASMMASGVRRQTAVSQRIGRAIPALPATLIISGKCSQCSHQSRSS